MHLIFANPLFGVGPNGFLDAVTGFQTPQYFAATGVGVTTDSPHNAELQALAAGGVLLLVLGLGLAAVIFINARRSFTKTDLAGSVVVFRIGCACGLVGYFLTLQTTFTSAANAILPMIMIGVLASANPEAVRTTFRERLLRFTSRIGFAALAVGMTTATIAEIPLQDALNAAAARDLPGALAAYDTARSWRPWDADVTLIEAQTLTQLASERVPDAAAAAVRWSETSANELPHSVLARKSLAAALEFDGREAQALSVAEALDRAAPHDPQTAARIREIKDVQARTAR
jgi:hypothetical protein